MRFFLFFLLILLFSINLRAQQIDSGYEVAIWPDFRQTAVSYTFDDGCSGQFTKAIPLFDEFEYPLTMYTVINWSESNWDKLLAASKNGHEVASHTISHPNLSSTSIENQKIEMETAKTEIDKKITNTKCLTIAYPYCVPGDYSVVGTSYIAARGCQGFIEEKTPKDFLNISSLICGSESAIKTAVHLNSKITDAISTKGWLVFLFHGVDDDGGYSSFPSDELRKNLEYVQKNDSLIWVATFLNGAKYVRERNAASVKELSVTADLITVAVSDTLDHAIYNYPITVRRTLPVGWNDAVVTQAGKSVAFNVVEVGCSKRIQFNAVPNGGDIEIVKRIKTEAPSLKKRFRRT